MKKFIAIMVSLVMLVCLGGCVVEIEPYYDTDGQTLKFVESKVVTLYEEEYIGLFFDYTNESGETKMACDGFDVNAYQNGVELSVSVFVGETTDGAIQCDTSVQTGHTARVVWLFSMVDESAVSVEVSNGETFTVENIKEMKEQVLFENENLKVSFIEIFEMPELVGTCYLLLNVENKSDKVVTTYLKDSYVNDTAQMIGSGVPMTLEPGKNSQTPFFFGYSSLGIESKDEIKKIEFKVWLTDDNYDTVVETETLVIDFNK